MAEQHDQSHSVVIIGGGLAGIAAATALASRSIKVTLLESRDRLGGRATSFVDPETGELLDNCQHVSMGCCTNLSHLCECLGIDSDFREQRELFFVDRSGTITRFAEGVLPAPFHLTGAFLKLPYLSLKEKRLFATAIRSLAKTAPEALSNINFEQWLRDHHQTETLIRDVWEIVLVSALSESLDRIDARYARKVFVDGFLANRTGWRVRIPDSTLHAIYSERTVNTLRELGVDVRMNARVATIHVQEGTFSRLTLRSGEELSADSCIVAIPQYQISKLFPVGTILQADFDRFAAIESAPITSVHLWYDRPITKLPNAVLLGRLSQWLFRRPEEQREGVTTFPYQVVISASRNLDGRFQQDVILDVHNELSEVWKDSHPATLLASKMITERRAVFSVTPGIDALRPQQQSPVSNLQWAGDWTQTDWPATMEGAVRSGYLAAENILRDKQISTDIVQPELSTCRLSQLIFGLSRQ